MAWTVLTESVEVFHGPILLEVVHPVLNSAFGWSLFTFKLMHETVLGFLKRTCLVIKLIMCPSSHWGLGALMVVDSAMYCKIRTIGE